MRVADLWSTAEYPILVRTVERSGGVDWGKHRQRAGRVVRRLPLLALIALPFVLGWLARWFVRAVFRVVWAAGWVASWLFYTAQEGWYAAAGRAGPQ